MFAQAYPGADLTLVNWQYDFSRAEYVCIDCDAVYYAKSRFHDKEELLDHLEWAHWCCRLCDQAFRTEHGQQWHWERASIHAGRWCKLCNDLIAGNETMAKHGWHRHWPCRACTAVFATSEGRDNHGQQQHQWCAVHKRAFINEDNYNAHMRSEAHVGRTHPCPCRCGRSFTDRATVTQHLEAVTCLSGITHAAVDQAMPSMDNKRFFTTDAAASSQEAIPPARRVATEESYDPKRNLYVCALCNSGFKTLPGLNAHLSSPRHTFAGANGSTGERRYKCPSTTCDKRFATLSGAVQHAENGTCGVTIVGEVNKALNSILRQLGQLKV